jgi:neutral trehalase
MSGECRKKRWEEAMRDVLAACESTKDFQPSTQAADGRSMETIRTTKIAPVMLQAMLVHLFRTTAAALRARGQYSEAAYYENEERQLAGVINRRQWRDVSETEGHYTDLVIEDGSQTGAFDATSCYPLLVGGIVPYDRAVKMAKLFQNKLARDYGYIISTARITEQWEGDPDNKETGELGDNRVWPSVDMWVVEAFLMAAIEAKAKGNDPEPLLRAAEAGMGMVDGVQQLFDRDHHITEKLNGVRPTEFVNGGEYGKKKEDVQKGFGMTIGAVRQLDGRNLRAEVNDPRESWRRLTFERRLGGLLVPAP